MKIIRTLKNVEESLPLSACRGWILQKPVENGLLIGLSQIEAANLGVWIPDSDLLEYLKPKRAKKNEKKNRKS